jgi:hypothetical protein
MATVERTDSHLTIVRGAGVANRPLVGSGANADLDASQLGA